MVGTVEVECNNLESSNASSDVAGEEKGVGRRRDDVLVSSGLKQKLNLDRRASNNERREDDGYSYRGPARRNTIDRRLTIKERRDKS